MKLDCKENSIKILVIGGAGFIGSNLCSYLSQNVKCSITVLDCYFTGSKLNHLETVNYVDGEAKDVAELITFKPDLIYHLGEYSRVEQSFYERDTTWKLNRDQIIPVIEFALKNNAKLVYSGSSTRFGDSEKGKFQSPYALSKYMNAEIIKCYGEWYGLKYAIAYFYNAYGPREISQGKYSTLIGIYKTKMLNNEKLPVVRPGTQKRNFTHVSDIVSGLALVGQHGFGDGFGIGSEEAYSIIEVANLFGGEIELMPERRGNRMSADLVTQRTMELGWKPVHKLDDYVDFLRKNDWSDPSAFFSK